MDFAISASERIFQSTRPVWGATMTDAEIAEIREFQSTRPVWGATAAQDRAVEDDYHFNPRAPCGARLLQTFYDLHKQPISIHAPRVGRDELDLDTVIGVEHFNPRAPCGARLCISTTQKQSEKFQSTRPVWGATTGKDGFDEHSPSFQSTRPVWGATRDRPLKRHTGGDFNPRAPCGARPRCLHFHTWNTAFQSTRPVWGATSTNLFCMETKEISIHAPRVGRDMMR